MYSHIARRFRVEKAWRDAEQHDEFDGVVPAQFGQGAVGR